MTDDRESEPEDDHDFLGDEDIISNERKRKHSSKYKKQRQLIRSALETHLLDYANKKNEQKRNLDELTSFIEEFADSFILLGYNYDGEPLTLVSADTQQQADSLGTLVQKFVVNSSNRQPPII